mgnify:FL=1
MEMSRYPYALTDACFYATLPPSMNISELARRLHVQLEELRIGLPKLGFDIGSRAVKIDDRTAWKIIQGWSKLGRQFEALRVKPDEEKIEAAGPVVKRLVKLPQVLTVRDFAATLSVPINKLISVLMKNGILASLNERLDYATASIIAEDMGFLPEPETTTQETDKMEAITDALKAELGNESAESLKERPPVIVIMGHVDHGKTTLLDTIRKANVVSQEAGGITQHIGAYQAMHKGRVLTFVDTPGHAAFTTMRSRGARVADLAVLVVAADDGVQPQTIEALHIIRAAGVPFLIAVNKVDKEGADFERIKSKFSELNVIPEEWGGKTPFVPISAKKGLNIDVMLETLLTLAEVEKGKIVANPDREAFGTIIESHLDPGEGAVATVLVQNGTLKRNDYLVFENMLVGRVRAMRDWNSKILDLASPGMPVRVLGFKVVPSVGDIVRGKVNAAGFEKARPDLFRAKISAAPIEAEHRAEELPMLNLVLKTDVEGSLEAIAVSLEKMRFTEAAAKIIGKGVGMVGEADVLQAAAGNATIYAFNADVAESAANLAAEKGVRVKSFRIIYDLLDDVKSELEGMTGVEVMRVALGRVILKQIFRSEKSYIIAGGLVEDGKIIAGARVNILRKGAPLGEGKIEGLQSGRQEAKEIPMGSEFGMKINTRVTLAEGDILEVFTEEKKKKTLTPQ